MYLVLVESVYISDPCMATQSFPRTWRKNAQWPKIETVTPLRWIPMGGYNNIFEMDRKRKLYPIGC